MDSNAMQAIGLFLQCLEVIVIPVTAVLFEYFHRKWQTQQRQRSLASQLRFEMQKNLHIAQGSVEIYEKHCKEFREKGWDPEEKPVTARRPYGWRTSVYDTNRREIWELLGEKAGRAFDEAYDKMTKGLWKGDDLIPPARCKRAFEEVVQLIQDAINSLPDC